MALPEETARHHGAYLQVWETLTALWQMEVGLLDGIVIGKTTAVSEDC
jgi:hypothetical protein|tara:strand:- start:539 stop:682 length:144 start_codon:yes stop_codon:yes gene_type:complete